MSGMIMAGALVEYVIPEIAILPHFAPDNEHNLPIVETP